jgi:hypothetical protein
MYPVKNQVSVTLANNDIKQVFNSADSFDAVISFIDSKVLISDDAKDILKKKFNS